MQYGYDKKEPGLRLPASASLPLASCWPRPQQLLPVSATGGGRRRCKWLDGWFTADAKKVPGVDASTGSLGQGVSIAVGMALGAKHLGKDTKVFALVGDGESQEGQIWEAYMAAAHYKLDNLTVIIDNNGLQIDGTNDQVMSLGDLPAKLRAFGFDLIELPDGNDLDAIEAALSKPTMPGKPKAILAHTVKGKGVSFMENQVGWHGKAPNAEQREQALKELED